MLKELNKSQFDAVTYIDGPSLVVAGAGSGKTRVLTYKISYLIEQGVMPWNILALTFTNKAAKEMKERIAKRVGKERASKIWMGTFHSVFSKILRINAGRIGFTSNFTIYDAADSKSLIKQIIKEMGLDDKKYNPGSIANRISDAKNKLMSPDVYARDPYFTEIDRTQNMSSMHEIYTRYCNRCRQADAMDFDDLLLYTFRLLRDNPDVREEYEQRFQYVLVDEYQDTNHAQHQIVWLLSEHNQRVTAVGDDAQSIYSFRGANIDNILKFRTFYKGAAVFKLEQNYRSTQTIVNAANSLIKHNRNQIHKDVFSEQEVGEPIKVCKTYSDLDEANLVAKLIHESHVRKQVPYGQMAILYRTNAQSRAFEETLMSRSIPYQIYGGLSFYQRKEVKDVISYLRLITNPCDEEALRRVINYPTRGIGNKTVEVLFLEAQSRQQPAWEVLKNTDTLGVNKGTASKLTNFAQMIQSFHDRVEDVDAATMVRELLDVTKITQELSSGKSEEAMTRLENVNELVSDITNKVTDASSEGRLLTVQAYLQEVSLLTDMDDDKTLSVNEKLKLMTVHSAKGLEFHSVYVVGLEEELFPSDMIGKGSGDVEEERRLMYVAMTRAMKELTLTFTRRRIKYGKPIEPQPSRFLKEIDSKYLSSGYKDRNSLGSDSYNAASRTYAPRDNAPARQGYAPSSSYGGYYPKREPSTVQRTPEPSLRNFRRVSSTTGASSPTSVSSTSTSASVCAGTHIIHDRFGEGTIINVEGSGNDTKATVEFKNVGTKHLLLRFAKFRVVD